ncbi:PP2C family protein-serine/threonine phosphatase [Lachnoclostridium sp.]|uniref:PP2C family protein-serine/threonine phosphatase n=1 Tax=Lachnoclostridium sp. TaxID=2028282 RepID=UPI00289C21D3|nr:PP2C family protein-serine/threonine phosphatase [Lachnoclostridium sp.]
MRSKARIRVAVSSHQGRRDSNEDNFYTGKYILEDSRQASSFGHKVSIPSLCAVCDGMGGMTNGKLASMNAATYIKEYNELKLRQLQTECCDDYQDSYVITWINKFINNLNASMSPSIQNQMNYGSTVAMIYLDRQKIYLSNVGDSRIYVFQNNSMNQLSVDHNQRANAVALGISPVDITWGSNILTQYLGMPKDEILLEPHVISLEYSPMTILICSDGLTEALDDKEIFNLFLSSRCITLKSMSKKYIQKALDNGSKDNITVMLIKIII